MIWIVIQGFHSLGFSLIFRAARQLSIIDLNAIHTSRSKCSDKERLWWELAKRISLREHWFALVFILESATNSLQWLQTRYQWCGWEICSTVQMSVCAFSSYAAQVYINFVVVKHFVIVVSLNTGWPVTKTERDWLCTSHSQLSIYVYRLVFGLILYILCGMQGCGLCNK